MFTHDIGAEDEHSFEYGMYALVVRETERMTGENIQEHEKRLKELQERA